MSTPGYSLEIVTWQEAESDIRLVRNVVFVEELGIPAELEWNGLDADYVYVIARDSAGNTVATGRINGDGNIGRMAVLPLHRGKGLGSELLKNLIQIANRKRINRVWLNAQIGVEAFYAKHGFEPVGEEFEEAGISHVKMEKQIRQV